jgi:hypothetical protein
MKQKLFLLMSLLFPVGFAVGSSDTVRFVNTGKMAVATNMSNGKVSLCIPHSVRMSGNGVSIFQQGTTAIGGNFFHDATTNIFYKTGDVFPSTGKILFFRNNGSGNTGIRRYVTTLSTAIDSFDRRSSFVAFPELEIRTKDTLVIPAKMGIDALRIIRSDPSYGKILLESKPVANVSYDASLRITSRSAATSAELAPEGSVIVERDLTPYRVEDGTTGAGTLFAYASPFKSQRSGYFAGNWVRKMLEDDNGHVQYVYGNKRDADNIILSEQYIVDPYESFLPGKGYLIKLRKKGFDYQELIASGGLVFSSGGDASDYDKSKFVFNGHIYRLGERDEQLFADSILFTRSINIAANAAPTYINWIIGNSYTAPISVKKIVDLLSSSSLMFEPYIYVFPQGSTGYQVFDIQNSGSPNGMQLIDLSEIPAMSYFMIRLDNRVAQNGTFTLRRNEILTHGKASHGGFRSSGDDGYRNEVVFRVSPESNPNIYDIAGIALRRNGNPKGDNYDIPKAGIGNNGELFYLYSVSEDGKKFSANVMPDTSSVVPLYFLPGSSEGRFRMEARRMESLRTNGLWLEDRKEGHVVDLLENGGNYSFVAGPDDDPARFCVRFRLGETSGMDRLSSNLVQVYYSQGELFIRGLTAEDAGSGIRIVDIRGQTLCRSVVKQAPEMSIEVSLPAGVYVFRMEGKRSVTLKFKR